MVVGAVVTLLNLVLSLVVGLRLLWAGLHGHGPERALAVYFLGTAVIGTLCLAPAYAGLADPAMAISDELAGILLGIGTASMAVGAAGVYVFTWRTFRPDETWARNLVILGCAASATGWILEATFGGFHVSLVPGPGHWLAWAGRTASVVWVGFECFRYRAVLQRRLSFGLADPVVVNRFLLWGIWAVTAAINLAADLGARIVYMLLAGTADTMVPAVLGPVVVATMSITMVLGMVSAVTLFLTFFPTRGYRRWIAERAAAAAA